MNATFESFGSKQQAAWLPAYAPGRVGHRPHLVSLHGARLGLAGRALGITLLDPLYRGDAVHVRFRFYCRPVLVQPRERSKVIAGSAAR